MKHSTLFAGLGVLLGLSALIAVGGYYVLSRLFYEHDHPTQDNQFLTMFLPPKPLEMGKYFADPKVAAFADAVWHGGRNNVKKGLADGIDVNAEGNQGFRPIFFAITKDTAVLKLLLAAGANPNVHLLDGDTPLHMAVKLPTVEPAALLLAAGADPNARGENDKPVIHAVIGEEAPALLRLLAKHGADLNVVWGGDPPLIVEIITYHWTTATTLLELGADVNYRDRLGRDAASEFCRQVSELTAVPSNRAGIPPLARAFEARGVHLPCAGELDKFR